MKLGLLSAILPDLSYEEVVDFASENGFKCLEICCWPVGKAERKYAGVTHIDVNDLSKDKADELMGYVKNRRIEISGLGYYPNPLDPDLEQRAVSIDHIKKAITAAALLGVNQMNTFIGRDPKASIPDSMADFRKTWPDIVKFAEDAGVKIGIENCPMFFTMDEWPGGKNLAASPKIWTEMFTAIDSRYFGLNYDPSHLVWQRMDYIAPIYDFAEKIFHIHIKDAKFFPEKYNKAGMFAAPLEYHAPKIPGYGDIKWGEFFCALSEIGYKGAAVIEVEDRSFEESLEARKRSILQSKQYLNQYIL
ncbi:MAG TPA: sugar phosphate isomerase/epimerase [Anaerovoracaceae bacterium]|nr:sugar phosphate isomerase/epimerase [Anaerovoracaceae bacterium]